jgi:hypothetical protein
MPDRVIVACPGGHPITTVVRGRSTSCPQPGCRRRVYVRADGTTRHGQPNSPAAADGRSSASPWPPGRDSKAEQARDSQPQQAAEPFKWGRRWDAEPPGADEVEYDAQADRTKLFDADDGYLGWMDGDPYDLKST